MAGNRTPSIAKIRGYILTRMKLGLGARDIYNEICGAYGFNEGFTSVNLLHDNAPCHNLVTDFLSQEKVKIVPHPLAPCDLFLFPRLKKYLWFPGCS